MHIINRAYRAQILRSPRGLVLPLSCRRPSSSCLVTSAADSPVLGTDGSEKYNETHQKCNEHI